MSGAEFIGIIGVVATIIEIVNFGNGVLTRLNEFRKNVNELPESFANVAVQLPLLLDTLDRIREQVSENQPSPRTEKALNAVVIRLREVIEQLDAVLRKVLPSARAGGGEKLWKAFKSFVAQKDVDELAATIRDFVVNLTVFQTTRNGDLINTLIRNVEERPLRAPTFPAEGLLPLRMVKYDTEYNNVDRFIGRDETLQEIWNRFESNTRVAISGIGGVGKSRVAYQFCYLFEQRRHDLRHVFWVHGGTRVRFEEAYRDIAQHFRIATSRDSEEGGDVDHLRLVCNFLSSDINGSWLMILDNCDDQELWLNASKSRTNEGRTLPLIDYLPRGRHGRILITTRDLALGRRLVEGQAQPIQLSKLSKLEARSLLQRQLPDSFTLNQEEADELNEALEYLPLTITQAAAYLEEIQITPTEYLDMLRAGQSDIPELLSESIDDPSRDREGSNSIFQTWKISFDHIQKQNQRAADMLSLMAMLDRQSISKDLLLIHGEGAIGFRAAIAKLAAFSLIEEDKAVSTYKMHRLVQVSTKRWLEHMGQLEIWQDAAVAKIAGEYPQEAHYRFWESIRSLGPHVHVVLGYKTSTPTCLIHRAAILFILGKYEYHHGHNSLACEYLEESRTIRQKHVGIDHEMTLTTESLLGVIYHKLKKPDLARATHIRVLEDAKRTLGDRHRLTLRCMGRLASTYNRRHEYTIGRDLLEQTLLIMKETFGEEDTDTLTHMGSLAYCMKNNHDFEAAELLEVESLRLRKRVLGPEHPLTITALTSLAWTLARQERLDEARSLELEALALRRKVYGPNSRQTLRVMRSLMNTFERQGMTDDAHRLKLEINNVVAAGSMEHHGSRKPA